MTEEFEISERHDGRFNVWQNRNDEWQVIQVFDSKPKAEKFVTERTKQVQAARTKAEKKRHADRTVRKETVG